MSVGVHSSTLVKHPTRVSAIRSMEMNSDERHRRIAEAAYFRAEQRGFRIGAELEDWLEAERVIDAFLARFHCETSNEAAESRDGSRNGEEEAIAPPST